jgi:hypothetical protein
MPKRMKGHARPYRGLPMAFKDYDDDIAIHQSMTGFLEGIWVGARPRTFCFLASSRPDGTGWQEHVIHADNMTAGLNGFFNRRSRWNYNLYFCPNAFSQPFRKKEFALPTSLGWCDMDDSDPGMYRPVPSLLWETSPRRFQALWLWDKRHEPLKAEAFSRALAERHGGDAGWTITKMLRIPGSVNHKPQYDEPIVRLVHRDWRRIAERPRIIKREVPILRPLKGVNPYAYSAQQVIARYRRKLHLKVRYLLDHDRVREADRSGCIYLIIAALHEAGADADEIASVIWRSPYFVEKHGQNLGTLNDEIARVIGKLGGES